MPVCCQSVGQTFCSDRIEGINAWPARGGHHLTDHWPPAGPSHPQVASLLWPAAHFLSSLLLLQLPLTRKASVKTTFSTFPSPGAPASTSPSAALQTSLTSTSWMVSNPLTKGSGRLFTPTPILANCTVLAGPAPTASYRNHIRKYFNLFHCSTQPKSSQAQIVKEKEENSIIFIFSEKYCEGHKACFISVMYSVNCRVFEAGTETG